MAILLDPNGPPENAAVTMPNQHRASVKNIRNP